MRAVFICLFFALSLQFSAQQEHVRRFGGERLNAGITGNVLTVFRVPQDGYYEFSIEGGFRPGTASTIYYCEYLLELKSDNNHVKQQAMNVATQAKDGDVCDFRTNLKNNAVSGIFHEGEEVQMRLLIQHCEVNGAPVTWVRTVPGTRLRIRQVSPAYVKDL